jgi:hypothetical protein
MVDAVIDRFEEDKAVILLGEEEKVLVVDRSRLPQGAGEGDWLMVDVREGRLVAATIDAEATEQARARIRDKLERLRRGEHLP